MIAPMKNTHLNGNNVKSLGSFSSEKFSIALVDYNSGLRQNWHKHEDFILAMILKGFVREQIGCQDELVKPFAVGVKSPDVNHTDYFWEKGVRVVRISLAPSFISDLKNKSLLEDGWNWLNDSRGTRSFLRIADNLFYNHSISTEISDNVYEILGSLLPVKSPGRSTDAPLWLRRAKENLEESFAEGIRLTELAARAEVHPVYFARKFLQFFGCSVGRYVRQLQFQKAANLLTNPQKNLADVAYQVGFSDQSHLTRTFAAEFGVTPANFRKLLK